MRSPEGVGIDGMLTGELVAMGVEISILPLGFLYARASDRRSGYSYFPTTHRRPLPEYGPCSQGMMKFLFEANPV